MWKIVAVAVVVLVTVACGSSPSTATSSPTPSGTIVVDVVGKTVNSQTENVLTDTKAMTLYYLTSDTPTTVACSGQCATFWPPLLLQSGDPASGSTLPGPLTVATTTNGRQVLYEGHPLYAFAKDKT